MRTLYIDRDPLTFRDISLHLQGYHVSPRDGTHFVRLFADAQFYSLPKLVSQLYEESIFMSIGHREFQIPRDLFSDPGNSPNFFSLGFAIFFSQKDGLFPGLDREGLIRPPSILPPSVPGRSGDTFAELLRLLRGYPVHIRDEPHRASLLRDARYFNFKGLEQRLIPHDLGFNQARGRDEIVLRIEDILKSGISVLLDPAPRRDPFAAWVRYARPFVDAGPAELVLEVGGENHRLHFVGTTSSSSGGSNGNGNNNSSSNNNNNNSSSPSSSTAAVHATVAARVEFFRDARARVTKLLEVIASKLNLPPTTAPLGLLMTRGGAAAASHPPSPATTPLCAADWVPCVLEPQTSVVLDGRRWTGAESAIAGGGGGGAGGGGGDEDAVVVEDGHGSDGGDDEDFSLGMNLGTMPGTPSAAAGAGGYSSTSIDSPTGFSSLSLHPSSRKRRRIDGGIDGSGSGSGGGGDRGGRGGGVGALDEEGRAGPGPGPGPAVDQVPRSGHWIVKTGQWRLRIRSAQDGSGGVECVLVAVKLDAMSGERARNEARGFLNG